MMRLKVIIKKKKSLVGGMVMIKKYMLIAVLAIAWLVNSLNGMEQKPELWSNLKTWWSKPQVDYVERNMPKIPNKPKFSKDAKLCLRVKSMRLHNFQKL